MTIPIFRFRFGDGTVRKFGRSLVNHDAGHVEGQSFNLSVYTSDKKRNLYRLAALIMLLLSFSFMLNAQYASIDGLRYWLDDTDFTATLDFNESVVGECVIPATVVYDNNSYMVTKIGSRAFLYYDWSGSYVSSVSIPSTFTSIDIDAFNNSAVETVNIDTENPAYTSIDGVVYDKYVTKIVACPSRQTTVTIPATVNDIPWSVFNYTDIESVNVEDDNQYYTSVDGVVYDNTVTSLVICPPAKERFTLPASVRSVDLSINPFGSGPSKLGWIDVECGNERYASYDGILYKVDLTVIIHIPPSRESIELAAPALYIGRFYSYDNLTTIEVQDGNEHYASYDGVLYDKSMSTLRVCPPAKQTINIPRTVTEIKTEAFYGCKYLKEIYYDTDEPIEADRSVFDSMMNNIYYEATLYVPADMVESIKQISPWKYFNNIKAHSFSSVDDLSVDSEASSEIEYYINMQGIKSSEPWKGLNIVVNRDGTSCKAMR